MTDTTTTSTIPGYRQGTWTIDPSHSQVGFSVRHLVISKVKGKFAQFDATFTTGADPLDSTVTATAQVESIDTGDANRDGHLRTNDFFDAANHPTLEFVSTGVRLDGDTYKVDGNLSLRGVTKPVTFDVEFGGFGEDPYGNYKAGLSATAQIDRTEFGVVYNAPLEKGGMLLGDTVTITIDIQAVLQG